MDGKLYWKKIGPQNGAETPSQIKDEAEILPYKVAAAILKDNLLRESGLRKIDKEMHEIWYEVEIQNRKIKLEDLIQQKDWEKILKIGLILKNERVITTGFILTVKPSSLTIKTGERVKVEVSITPIDSYDLPISIEAEKGTVTPSKGKAPFEATWDLDIIEEIGEHRFRIKAIGEDGTESTSSLTVVVEGLEKEIETRELDLTHMGAKLVQITPENLTSLQMAAETLSKLNQEAIVQQLTVIFDENATFSCREIDSKLASHLAQRLREIEMTLKPKETRFTGLLKLKQPITLDSSKINALTPLSGKVTFKLRVLRE